MPPRARPCQRSGGPRAPLAIALLLALGAPPLGGQPAPGPARRLILVSFDGLNEARARATVDPRAIPTFTRLFTGAACAASARPPFHTMTAPGHAALWTGAYGDRSGVASNSVPLLPRPAHTLLSSVSGYFADALRAEPLWLTAGKAGRGVAGHHVTQAPAPPAYAGLDGPEALLEARRDTARATLARPGVAVMNGYNVLVHPWRVLTERDVAPRPPARWRGLATLPRGVPPRELAWAVGEDSLFALLLGGRRYDRVLVAPRRDVRAGTIARLAPVTLAASPTAPLARHFAPGRLIRTAQGPAALSARLWELSPDGRRFRLAIPELRVVQANRGALVPEYLRAIGGWWGNGALTALRAGALGPTLAEGGDGTAERRYVESLELVTRQFIRGAEWLWRTRRPVLLLDYFPLLDEVDHEWFGRADSTAAGHDSALAARLAPLRAAAWALGDRKLAALRALVAGDPGAALVVSGDHGMRSYWRILRPNVLLEAAGLLVRDTSGAIDLARTRALSPTGAFVVLNRVAWRAGIVPPSAEAALRDSVERVLRAARDAAGAPIVTATWRSDAPGADTLGLGGPTGGDVYFDLARGWYWSPELGGPLERSLRGPVAGHGFPSVNPEMHTVLCLWGDAVPARRIGPVRSTAAALVAAEWLGLPRPADAVGDSPLGALLGR